MEMMRTKEKNLSMVGLDKIKPHLLDFLSGDDSMCWVDAATNTLDDNILMKIFECN